MLRNVGLKFQDGDLQRTSKLKKKCMVLCLTASRSYVELYQNQYLVMRGGQCAEYLPADLIVRGYTYTRRTLCFLYIRYYW